MFMNPKKNASAIITLATLAIAFTACEDNRNCDFNAASNTLSCPEKTYATVTIDGKIWMAENLDVYVPDSSTCYDNNHSNCETTGRLYTWQAASASVCPTGWELPTREEFKKAFGDMSIADLKKITSFNLQFAGFKYYDGKFADKDISASFWTKESYDDSRAYLIRATNTTITYEHYNKNIFASVRCVKK